MLIEIFTASEWSCSLVKHSGDFLLFWKVVAGIALFLPLCGAVEIGDGMGWDVLPTARPLAAAALPMPIRGFALPVPHIPGLVLVLP